MAGVTGVGGFELLTIVGAFLPKVSGSVNGKKYRGNDTNWIMTRGYGY